MVKIKALESQHPSILRRRSPGLDVQPPLGQRESMSDNLVLEISEACKNAHTAVMAEGGVLPPRLFVLRAGQLLGYVALRPVYVGRDAAEGIATMSYLAAAAEADEVIGVWETQDLAVACDHVPLHPGPGLNLLHASAKDQVLYRYPYREWRLPGQTRDGLAKAKPQWLTESSAVANPSLEPAIEAMVGMCWQPFEVESTDMVNAAAAYLTELGYTVELTTAAAS
ncbi:hypothetical protein [Nonomuraea sp. NPDC049400]|uniref:hypothetical protein n=1 Tax=Nonomuraea sp. NPDC049400 TaxID=3364352 RepID=UPI0037B9521A